MPDFDFIEQIVWSPENYVDDYSSYGYSGMGDDVYSQTRPRTVTTQGHSTRDAILGAIGAGLQTVNAWIAVKAGQPYALTQQPNGQLYQQQLSGAQLQQLQALQSGTVASASATDTGLNIGGSSISWPLILLIIGGIFLLQSPGYSKRS